MKSQTGCNCQNWKTGMFAAILIFSVLVRFKNFNKNFNTLPDHRCTVSVGISRFVIRIGNFMRFLIETKTG